MRTIHLNLDKFLFSKHEFNTFERIEKLVNKKMTALQVRGMDHKQNFSRTTCTFNHLHVHTASFPLKTQRKQSE